MLVAYANKRCDDILSRNFRSGAPEMSRPQSKLNGDACNESLEQE